MYKLFEGDQKLKTKLMNMVSVESVTRVQSTEGISRIKARVRFGKSVIMMTDYSRRPVGGGEGEGEEAPPIRPLTHNSSTEISYSIECGREFERPEIVLAVEVEAARDRPIKDPVAGGEGGEGKDVYNTCVFPDGMEAMENLLKEEGLVLPQQEMIVYLFMYFDFFEREWEMDKFIIEGAFGEGGENSEGEWESEEEGEEEEGSASGAFEKVD